MAPSLNSGSHKIHDLAGRLHRFISLAFGIYLERGAPGKALGYLVGT